MEIRTTARHFELTDNLRKFAEQEIKRLEKYYDVGGEVKADGGVDREGVRNQVDGQSEGIRYVRGYRAGHHQNGSADKEIQIQTSR